LGSKDPYISLRAAPENRCPRKTFAHNSLGRAHGTDFAIVKYIVKLPRRLGTQFSTPRKNRKKAGTSLAPLRAATLGWN
jgi:hypothetical protein